MNLTYICVKNCSNDGLTIKNNSEYCEVCRVNCFYCTNNLLYNQYLMTCS